MYKVTTSNSSGTIVGANSPHGDWFVQMGDEDPVLVWGNTPLEAFQAAEYDVLSVVALSYE